MFRKIIIWDFFKSGFVVVVDAAKKKKLREHTLYVAICVSLCANVMGKGMNPYVLS